MKKLFKLLIIVFTFTTVKSQIILNNDTTVCGMQSFDLFAISADVDSLVTDDVYTDVVDIGFNFDFYGNTYNKMLISSNGYVTFDTTNAAGWSPWAIGAPIPNPGVEPENAIMVTWQDTDPNFGGAIYFGSFGQSPNKVYVVTWCAIPMFQCNSLIYTSQLRMYEGTNKIEMFLQDKPICLTWNGGAGIQGTVDATSTNFDIVTDPILLLPRNFPTPWTATNEGWEFIPNGTTSFTINSIPFTAVAAGNTTWSDVNGNTLGIGQNINVTPTTTTTYYATMQSQCSGTIVDSITITVGSLISSNISSTDATCLGNDATLTVTPDLNTTQPPWDISLLDGNGAVVQIQNNVWNTHTFTGLFPGSYIINVIEPISGCSGSNNVVVDQMPIALTLSTSAYNVNCYNGTDGKISAVAQNGVLPYQFYIDGILNTNPFPADSIFSNLTNGTYIISVVDDNTCMQRDTVYITAPGSPLQALTSSKTVLCHQDSTGFAVAQAAGGTFPYSYEWHTSSGVLVSMDDTASSLVGGLYFVEVTDANGCDTVGSVQILTPNTAVTSSTEIGEVVCKGDPSGYIVGDAGGGFAPYTYTWSTSLGGVIQTTSGSYNTDTLHNVYAGIYLLDIVDHYGCSVSQSSISVNEPLTALSIDTLYLIDSVFCYGDNDGRSLAVVSGGDPSYVYSWDNGESTLLANALTGGYHIFSVVDERGCEVFDSIYIPESPEIISTLLVEESVACYGFNNGIVSVSTIGGYADYIYSWSNGQALDTGLVDTAYNLSYGVYALTTEDSLGCSVVDSIFMYEPGLLTMESHELEWISCFGADDGLASSSAQGGTEPYTFVWDNNQIGDTVNTLTPGLHTVVVTDARGCTASDTVTIHEPDVLTVSISVEDYVYCNGVSTGVLKANPLGGTPFTSTSYSYTYLWDDALQASQTTQTATNLAADVYTVVVTDSRGCTATDTSDITAVTNTMDLDTSFTNVSCYGSLDGTASVVASGGHAPYSYHWVGNNGATLSTLDAIQNLSAGTYSVTVSDTNNCTRNTSVDILEPLPIVYNISGSDDEYCVGACDGEIFIDTLSGGILPYSALLTNNTTGITTSHSITAASILDVCSGDYTVALTNNNACSSSVIAGGNDQALVGSVNPQLPAPLVVVTNDASCYDGNDGAIALVGAPDPAWAYTWYDTNGNQVGTGNTANNLEAGDYYVMAQFQNLSGGSNPAYYIGPVDTSTAGGQYSDYNGHLNIDCTSPSKLVSAVVYAELANTITFELRDANGSVLDDITLTVAVGQQTINFDFDIPVGTDLELGVSAGNTRLYRNNAGSGNNMGYAFGIGNSVTITSANNNNSQQYYYFYYDLEIQELSSNVIAGCEVVSDTLTIQEPDSISILETSNNAVLCNGGNSGGLSVQVSGGTPGTPPYTYTWTPNQTTNTTIANLTAGTYILDVEDGNNCTQTSSFNISEPPAINASITQGSNIYILTALLPTGGTPPFSYSWREQSSPSVHLQGGTTYNVYAPGTYYVVVEDANGCEVQSNSFTYTSSPTSVVDATSEIDLNIYPNPFRETTTVDFGREINQATITIVDVYGKLIEQHELSNTQTYVIEKNSKASGVYFMEIEIEEITIKKKLIIE